MRLLFVETDLHMEADEIFAATGGDERRGNMGIFKLFGKRGAQEETLPPEYYTERETEELEGYIEDTFGASKYVLHDLLIQDMHIDIAIIDPTPDRPYYTLVTMGMGSHRMNVPRKVRKYHLEYAELVMYLPKTWDMNSQEDQHTWAVQWMKRIPEMVQDTQSWIGMGHLIDYNQTSLISSIGFRAAATMPVFDNEGEWVRKQLSTGRQLSFYQLIPLYHEEAEYAQREGEVLKVLERMDDDQIRMAADVNRKNFGY